MQVLQDEVCACRKELNLKSAAVRRATQDWEELAKDKAALDVKLNSANQKSCGLSQELLALRSDFVSVALCGPLRDVGWDNFDIISKFLNVYT